MFMTKLYLIRHAKSSWDDLSLDDFERTLNKRGLKNSFFMGKILKNKNILPDLIISSPALRAKTTAKNIAKTIAYKGKIIYDENIYESDLSTLYKLIKSLDDKAGAVFIFGHNPGFNMLADKLVDLYDNIPTCGFVEIDFNCDSWKDISAKNAKLISFDYPKRYN